LPKEFGVWQTGYNLFARWAKSGALERLLQAFRECVDNEWLSIDSSSIKVHKHGSVPKGGQKNNA